MGVDDPFTWLDNPFKQLRRILLGLALSFSFGIILGIILAGFIDKFTGSQIISLIIGIPSTMIVMYIIGYGIALQIIK